MATWKFHSGDEILKGWWIGGLYQLTQGGDENPDLLLNIMQQVQKYGELACIMSKMRYFWNGGEKRWATCYAIFRKNNWGRIDGKGKKVSSEIKNILT